MAPEDRSSAARPYFPQLDGVRAIALLMVMAFHLAQREEIAGFAMLGQTGVDLFFVLSGFLITTILLLSPAGDTRELRTFYIRRTLRIFPLYYAALIGLACLGHPPKILFWFYLENFSIARHFTPGPNHFWSLAVEEQFYLVQPFLVLFFPRKYLAAALWTIVASALLTRFAVTAWTPWASFYLTPCRVDGLAAGALLALAHQRGMLGLYRHALVLLGAGTGTLLLLLFVRFHGLQLPSVQDLSLTLITGFYAAVVGLTVLHSSGAAARILSSRGLRSAGRVSYGAYVFHPFVFDWVYYRLAPRAAWNRILLSSLLTFALSYLSWFGFERHFLRLKEVWAPERKRFVHAVEQSLDGGNPALPNPRLVRDHGRSRASKSQA